MSAVGRVTSNDLPGGRRGVIGALHVLDRSAAKGGVKLNLNGHLGVFSVPAAGVKKSAYCHFLFKITASA